MTEIITMRKESDKVELRNVVKALQKEDITMVEIGSYARESAETFLATGLVSKIYCVDPWQMHYDDNDGASLTNMEEVEKLFDNRHSTDDRVVKVKGTIETFLEKHTPFPEIDFVYIDGNHIFNYVLNDIMKSAIFLKPRIAIGGHDVYNADVSKALSLVQKSMGFLRILQFGLSWMFYTNEYIPK